MNECPEPEERSWREQGTQGGAPKVGWVQAGALGHGVGGGAGTGQGRALGAVPLGVTGGLGGQEG